MRKRRKYWLKQRSGIWYYQLEGNGWKSTGYHDKQEAEDHVLDVLLDLTRISHTLRFLEQVTPKTNVRTTGMGCTVLRKPNMGQNKQAFTFCERNIGM